MALEFVNRSLFFQTKEIWFAAHPFDVEDCVSVTFRQSRAKVHLEGFERSEFSTLVIDLTQPLDQIWRAMDANSCRYKIKRAPREGVQIERSADYDRFFDLHRRFADRKGLGTGGLSYREMRRLGTLFLARHEQTVIAGQLYLEDIHHMRYLLGASVRLESDPATAKRVGFANRALMWEAIQYAKGKGIWEFDLGGYYTGTNPDDPRHGINAFKRGFGGHVVTHFNYSKCYATWYRMLRSAYRFAHP